MNGAGDCAGPTFQPSLARSPQAFAMSPATFKRKLQKHDTGFQQVDLARKHVAFDLYQFKGFSKEEVADYRRFNDARTFVAPSSAGPAAHPT